MRLVAVPLLLAAWVPLLGACTPMAVPAVPPPARQVSVSATSRINVAPDEAVIRLTFSATAPGMRKSHSASASSVEAFRTAVAALGVPPDALELCGTTDDPNYRWSSSTKISSFTSTTLLNVRTKDFERVADIVDAAVASGATAVDVSYRSTTLPEHKKHARDLAMTAAREKAQQLALGMGATLGGIQSVTEGATSSRSGMYSFSENVVQTEVTEASEALGPMAPGTTPLELTIQATFLID